MCTVRDKPSFIQWHNMRRWPMNVYGNHKHVLRSLWSAKQNEKERETDVLNNISMHLCGCCVRNKLAHSQTFFLVLLIRRLESASFINFLFFIISFFLWRLRLHYCHCCFCCRRRCRCRDIAVFAFVVVIALRSARSLTFATSSIHRSNTPKRQAEKQQTTYTSILQPILFIRDP